MGDIVVDIPELLIFASFKETDLLMLKFSLDVINDSGFFCFMSDHLLLGVSQAGREREKSKRRIYIPPSVYSVMQ